MLICSCFSAAAAAAAAADTHLHNEQYCTQVHSPFGRYGPTSSLRLGIPGYRRWIFQGPHEGGESISLTHSSDTNNITPDNPSYFGVPPRFKLHEKKVDAIVDLLPQRVLGRRTEIDTFNLVLEESEPEFGELRR